METQSAQRDQQYDSIELTRRFPYGRGRTTSTESSLFRPFIDLVKFNCPDSGRPVGKVNYLFFSARPQRQGMLGILLWKAAWWKREYILGSLCRTVAGRTLFFPGLTQRTICEWRTVKDAGRQTDQNSNLGVVDHITLESDYCSGHVTTKTKGNTRTHPFECRPIKRGELIYWFGLAFRPSALEITPSIATWKVSAPSSDSSRRFHELKKATEDAEFHGLSPSPSGDLRVNEFFHTAFYLWHSDKEPPSPLPPLYVPFCSDERTSGRLHDVNLAGLNGKVLALVSRHSGAFRGDGLFDFHEFSKSS